MANYWHFHRDDEFQNKVKYEMQKAAIAVMSESAATTGHADRVVFAKKILAGEANVKEFCIGVLTNATIKGHVDADTDYTSDLAFTVSSMFNAFAGIATE